eukprot:TRINITY_DN10983_c0_g1_i1.p2 TRINITY_DN10983_c0_g1~~TRINITY_DN10983_c0_g1_i1.p2  ORF type:complete len:283 (+),score=86.06 TRINITY_DN10983_c0_g1_i1:89-937(+)
MPAGSQTEGPTDYLSRLMVPELVDGLMTQLVDERPKEVKAFLAARLLDMDPPQEGSGDCIELYIARISMNCLGPWLLVRLAGLEHKVVDVDLMAGEHKKVGFTVMNPNQQIPTMRDGQFPVFESCTIMRYLCNKCAAARKFYPPQYEIRARCDMALDWRQCNLYPHIRQVAYPALGWMPGDADKESAASEALTNDVNGSFKVLTEYFLHGRNFICGHEVTIADLSVVPALRLLDAAPHVEIPAAVQSYCKRFADATGWNELLDGGGGFGWNQFLASKQSGKS